jgi:hypothetical protein
MRQKKPRASTGEHKELCAKLSEHKHYVRKHTVRGREGGHVRDGGRVQVPLQDPRKNKE